MKESWLYYDYLRRWWRLLILGLAIGAILGLAYYSVQKNSESYAATATVAIGRSNSDPEALQPPVMVTIASDKQSTSEAAIAQVQSAIDRITDYANTPVSVPSLELESKLANAWWKPIVLGSVLGGLLMIGGIYVWEDALAYHRSRQLTGPLNY